MNAPVLIVDDSLTIRMDLADTLQAAGLATVACASAEEARRALRERLFSLVILDVMLPDADGVELLREIRQGLAAGPTAVMLLSTEAEVRHRVRGLTTGADEYIGKPYERSYLVARVRELVRRGEPAEAGQRVKILVIDDSLTFREELRAALEGAGYEVLTADSGEEGLRLAGIERPTAAIVDGLLPGIDGATVIRRIRLDAALRRLPCLLLTASEDVASEIQALDAGADAFVRKGEDIAVILAKLAAVLRSAGGPADDRSTASLQGPKKILAVDDSETYLQELARALRGDGYEVVLARRGEEALELLAIQPVDCILLDLLMPGIGGQEACRRIKGASAMRDIPVVMLTSLEDRGAMIQGLAAGADDYIAKSSDFEVLRARVLAQIRRKQFEDQTRSMRERLLLKEMEAAEARSAQELAETRAALIAELESKNQELEAFSYSVAHDLRAPLRSLDGFSAALLEDYGDRLDEEGRLYLRNLRESAQQMAQLIDDLLSLSRVVRSEFRREEVDLTEIAHSIVARLRRAHPGRDVTFAAPDALAANGDPRLLAIALENLLGNAWKFTGKRSDPRVELAVDDKGEVPIFILRDNGAGFDMAYASKLFGVFQRLHSTDEFEGTGIGLATVQRVIRRHGGRIWAEGEPGRGATFYFTLRAAAPAGANGA